VIVRSTYRAAWQAITSNPAYLLFAFLLFLDSSISVAIESSWRSPAVDCLWGPVSLVVSLGAQLGIVQLALAGNSHLRLTFGQAVRGAKTFFGNGLVVAFIAGALALVLLGCGILTFRLGGFPTVPPVIVLIGRLVAMPLFAAVITFTFAGIIAYRLNPLQAVWNALLVASNNPLATLLMTAPFALVRLALDVLILSAFHTATGAMLAKVASNLGTLFAPVPRIIAGSAYALIALFEMSVVAIAYLVLIARHQYPWTNPEPDA
jgi:hypothetical protein